MSSLLELLGKGLQAPFLDLILPGGQALTGAQAERLSAEVEQDPEHTANVLRLALHYVQSGNGERAERLFGSLLPQASNPTEVHLAWSGMHMSAGNLERALAQLQKAADPAADPAAGDSRICYAQGLCLERLGKPGAALEAYQKALTCRPYLRQAAERMGAIHLYENAYPAVVAVYRQLQKEHPDDVCVYLYLGQMLLHQQDYPAAVETFERALTIEPDNFELHDDSVEELTQAGRYQEAILELHRIVDEQGEFADNHMRLGDLYSKTGDDRAAVCQYERALELHPGYLEAAVKLGTQHLRQKRYREAAANFNRAIEINDQLITAYVGLGIAQQFCRESESAHDTLDLAAALEPNTNLLFAEMSRLQLQVAMTQKSQADPLGQIVGAAKPNARNNDLLDLQIERHRQALQNDPNHADLHYRYGLLLRGRGKDDQAIEHWSKAVQINPSFGKALIKLGLALREQGRSAEGAEHLQRALRSEPEDIDLHYRLALLYCDRMQFALAVEQFETALKDNPDRINVQANLTLALQTLGLIDRAGACWQAVCELEPESSLAFQAQRAMIGLKSIP